MLTNKKFFDNVTKKNINAAVTCSIFLFFYHSIYDQSEKICALNVSVAWWVTFTPSIGYSSYAYNSSKFLKPNVRFAFSSTILDHHSICLGKNDYPRNTNIHHRMYSRMYYC